LVNVSTLGIIYSMRTRSFQLLGVICFGMVNRDVGYTDGSIQSVADMV